MFKEFFWCYVCVTCVLSEQIKEPTIFSLWRNFPLNIMINKTLLQPECQKAYQIFLDSLNNDDLNSLKMLDASAKLPSGILSGNINQYGDFNECMEVTTAQYCLVELDLEPWWEKSYGKYKHLAHSFYLFKEKFNDPAHRLPGFTMARWGFCIPDKCSSNDLERSLKENFGLPAQVRPGMCQKATKEIKSWTFGDYIARIFFGVIISAVVISTLIDYTNILKESYITETGILMKILMSFSLLRNISSFFKIKENNNNEIAGLHCIRSLSALALLMSHKSVSLFFNPFMNRTHTINRLSQPWTIIAKNAIIYTDCFMLLSGLLNANALLTDLNNGYSMKFKDKLINRIFRILPNVVALILFCTYILPSMGSGPLWPTVIDHHSTLCKLYMWRNILFIHNYFGFENMCLTHTHQLGIDMQLFLITPILVYLIWKNRQIGIFVFIILGMASTVLRFSVSYKNELTSVIYFGIPISKMFMVANLSYILPTHRATMYLIGVYMAYLLKYSKPNISLSKIQLAFLWCFFLACFFGTWLGPYHMVLPNYVYNKLEASLIAALYPIFWGASIAFGIYATNKKIAGWFGELICWKYFQIITKIAYALYLVQFPVFFYNVGTTKHVDEYQPYYQLQVLETSTILVCSFILVMLIEMPFQSIKKIVFDQDKKHRIRKIGNDQHYLLTRKSKSG